MALTSAQRLALFEILQCTDVPVIQTLSGSGQLVAYASDASSSTIQTVKKIDDFLLTMAADSGKEAYITNLLDRWNTLGTSTVSVSMGSVGTGINGVTSDPQAEREVIREKIRAHIPFWRNYNVLEKSERSWGSMEVSR